MKPQIYVNLHSHNEVPSALTFSTFIGMRTRNPEVYYNINTEDGDI
jgi:hypothetical protein